jgi:hypothetical protein
VNQQFSRRRILVLSAVLASFAAAYVVAPIAIARYVGGIQGAPAPLLASDTQQGGIVRVLIGDKSFDGYLSPPAPPLPPPSIPPSIREPTDRVFVLVDQTLAICSDDALSAVASDDCTSVLGPTILPIIDAKFPRPLIRDLLEGNRQSGPLSVPPDTKTILVSRRQIDDMFSYRGGWERFHNAYPGTLGLLNVSRAVLSRDGAHALIYVSRTCGGLCGVESIHYLVRTRSGWRIDRSFPVGVR